MASLTQCWFTRLHEPVQAGRRDGEGVFRSTCRHCERPIISWDRKAWHLAEGFNLLEIYQGMQTAFLYLVDTRDDFVVARFPIDHLGDEAKISAYAAQIREENSVNVGGSFLVLRDSRDPLAQFKSMQRAASGKPSRQKCKGATRDLDAATGDGMAEPDHVPDAGSVLLCPTRAEQVIDLPGRAAFEAVFEESWARARDKPMPLTVAFCDIDFLDRINRRHGLDAGDALIRHVAGLLTALPDSLCHVSRNRGFEFIVLFRGQGSARASAQLDKVRRAISGSVIDRVPAEEMSMCCGLADVPLDGDRRAALRAADFALHMAKTRGRDHLVVGDPARA